MRIRDPELVTAGSCGAGAAPMRRAGPSCTGRRGVPGGFGLTSWTTCRRGRGRRPAPGGPEAMPSMRRDALQPPPTARRALRARAAEGASASNRLPDGGRADADERVGSFRRGRGGREPPRRRHLMPRAVTLDGRVATMGEKADPARFRIAVDGRAVDVSGARPCRRSTWPCTSLPASPRPWRTATRRAPCWTWFRPGSCRPGPGSTRWAGSTATRRAAAAHERRALAGPGAPPAPRRGARVRGCIRRALDAGAAGRAGAGIPMEERDRGWAACARRPGTETASLARLLDPRPAAGSLVPGDAGQAGGRQVRRMLGGGRPRGAPGRVRIGGAPAWTFGAVRPAHRAGSGAAARPRTSRNGGERATGEP